jgi:hypothetical protein
MNLFVGVCQADHTGRNIPSLEEGRRMAKEVNDNIAQQLEDSKTEVGHVDHTGRNIPSLEEGRKMAKEVNDRIAQQLEDSKVKIVLFEIGEEEYRGSSIPVFKTANAVSDVFILELENGKTVGVFERKDYVGEGKYSTEIKENLVGGENPVKKVETFIAHEQQATRHLSIKDRGLKIKRVDKVPDLSIDDESVLKNRTQAIASDLAFEREGRGSILDAGIKMKDPYDPEQEDVAEEIEIKYEPTYKYDETLSTNGKRLFLKYHYGIGLLSDKAIEKMYSILTTGEHPSRPKISKERIDDEIEIKGAIIDRVDVSSEDNNGEDVEADKIDVRHAKAPEKELSVAEMKAYLRDNYGIAVTDDNEEAIRSTYRFAVSGWGTTSIQNRETIGDPDAKKEWLERNFKVNFKDGDYGSVERLYDILKNKKSNVAQGYIVKDGFVIINER